MRSKFNPTGLLMLRYFTLARGLLAAAVGPAAVQTAPVAAVGRAGVAASVPAAAPVDPAAYFITDELPASSGGDAALLKFLTGRLNYSAAALDRCLLGKVHLTFTVDSEGRLHDPRVVRGLGAGLDEKALRLVRLMPWCKPGKIHGQPVWVGVTRPIVFRAL